MELDRDDDQGIIDALGLDDSLLGKMPDGIGDKLKGLL